MARAWALSAFPRSSVEVGTDHVPGHDGGKTVPPIHAHRMYGVDAGSPPGGTRSDTPYHHMALWLRVTAEMRLCRVYAQGGV